MHNLRAIFQVAQFKAYRRGIGWLIGDFIIIALWPSEEAPCSGAGDRALKVTMYT
jgi:hypothetical protein